MSWDHQLETNDSLTIPIVLITRMMSDEWTISLGGSTINQALTKLWALLSPGCPNWAGDLRRQLIRSTSKLMSPGRDIGRPQGRQTQQYGIRLEGLQFLIKVCIWVFLKS